MTRAKKVVDWPAVEREYRAGIRSLKDISEEFSISDAGILKRAKRDSWERDLSSRIAAKAEAKVSAALVSEKVSAERTLTEKVIVESNATMIASAILTQRKDVARSRKVVTALFEELEGQLGDVVADLGKLGELMFDPDDKGVDKLNELYRKIISLPGRTDTAKKLSESLRILIELERKVLRIKDEPEQVDVLVKEADPNLSRAEAYMRMIGKK
jgi:DNA polymerase III delta prime subunit